MLTKDLLTTADSYKITLGEANDEVVIGDPLKPTELIPQIEFSKWEGECKLKIICPPEICSPVASAVVGKELAMDSSKTGWYFLPCSQDVIKFGLLLYETPKENKWSFKLENWEDLSFYHYGVWEGKTSINDEGEEVIQDPNRENYFRVAKFNGGVVVRSKTHKINLDPTASYFGTFKRPRLLDGDGNFICYGNLEISDGIYTIIAEQSVEELAKAKLPIRFNDEFGNHTTDDATYSDLPGGYCELGKYVMSASGTITGGGFYGNGRTATRNMKLLIYTLSGTSATKVGISDVLSVNTTKGWKTFSFTTTVAATPQTYGLAIVADDNWRCYELNGSYTALEAQESCDYDSPGNLSGISYFNSYWPCIYATYTAGGGGGGYGCDLTEKFIMFD